MAGETWSVVSPDDHWAIWATLVGGAALSIWLEQRNAAARKVTGAVIALFAGMALSNVGFLPTSSASYDVVWNYVVPLVVPLLLLRLNVLRVVRETGRLFGAFHLAALGTVLGTVAAVWLFGRHIPELPKIGAAMSASYIGGSVNFVAMVSTFEPTAELSDATIVADNAVMALYFLLLIALPAIPCVRRAFSGAAGAAGRAAASPAPGGSGTASAEDFWRPRPISLLGIALALACAFAIAAASDKVSGHFARGGYHPLVRDVLGQKYLVLTTLSVLFPIAFPRLAASVEGSEELGTFFIYVFFILVGVPASFEAVFARAPLLFAFCAVILSGNFAVAFGLGRLLGYRLEELVLAAVVTSGGPMNGAAIAISKGWAPWVFPSVLAGLWGYCIGNYVGFAVGKALSAAFG